MLARSEKPHDDRELAIEVIRSQRRLINSLQEHIEVYRAFVENLKQTLNG